MIFKLDMHPSTGLAHLMIQADEETKNEYKFMIQAAECYERTARQHDVESQRLKNLALGARTQAATLKELANL